jgi:hypothetical protein
VSSVAHLVELCCLVGAEQTLDLLVSAVAHLARYYGDGIQLGSYGFVQREDLPVLQIDKGINRPLLLWSKLELLRHALAKRASTAAFVAVICGEDTVGGEAKCAPCNEGAEQEH